MTKRHSDFDNINGKRAKLDDIEGLWDDDDFDSEAIEDCFLKATQCDNQNANTTILPSYNAFKQGPDKQKIFTSTQAGPSISTFRTNGNNMELQQQLQELQRKCREKEGEITILRENFKKLRDNSLADQEKKRNEFKQQLNAKMRENETIKSELEFKNLEVANLKQSILELTKLVQAENQSQRVMNKSIEKKKVISTSEQERNNKYKENPKIQINELKIYPFKRFRFHEIFPMDAEKNPSGRFFTTNFCAKNSIPYLQNQLLEQKVIEKRNFGPHDLAQIYPDIIYLINLTLFEINSNNTRIKLTNIQAVLRSLLNELDHYLIQLEDSLQLQEIQHKDSLYLKLQYNAANDTKIAENCGKIIVILAEYLLFTPDIFKDFYDIILKIITNIGRTRSAQNCSVFIKNLLRLLTRHFNLPRELYNLDIIFEIAQELFLSRPDFSAIISAPIFIKSATRNPDFVKLLCRNNIVANSSSHKGVMYFSKNSCLLQVCTVSLENMFLTRDINISLSCNVLNIIYNIFKSNVSWLHLYENRHCECLSKLYKIGVDVIYKSLLSLVRISKYFLKCCIKTLYLFISNSEYLIQKYVMEFAQFKKIVKLLNRICDDDLTQYLNELNNVLIDEIPDVAKSAFVKVEF